jgi:hypothetical protein
MLKGARAYDIYHAMAPQAPFRLLLKVRKAGLDIAAVTLKVVGVDSSAPVSIAADGSFELPRLSGPQWQDAELVLNQKKGENAIGWGPFIRSPELGADTRRLGDLRLECEIQWAIDQDDLSFVARNALKLIGGPCNSSRVQMQFAASSPLTAAILRTAGREQPLNLGRNLRNFIVPLHDKTWPDEALIELRYPLSLDR